MTSTCAGSKRQRLRRSLLVGNQIAEGVHEGDVGFYLRRGDYSRSVKSQIVNEQNDPCVSSVAVTAVALTCTFPDGKSVFQNHSGEPGASLCI